jgi:hypothetical protein
MTDEERMTDAAAGNPASTGELVKKYAILAYGAFGTMADVGLMVLGSLQVGLSVAVLLQGFGLADVFAEELSTGATLISAIVLAVVGLFCLGVAAEGPLGRGRRLTGFEWWEVGIGRVLAVFICGLIGLFVYRFVFRFLAEVPSPVIRGAEGIRAVSVAAMTAMPLIGVPLVAGLRLASDTYRFLALLEIPMMFLVWALASMIILT